MVRVSVLMPVYRTNEEYLREAISSILAQTYSDFEFLILDDCPEDDRELIVKSYKDRRIKYLRNETNMGISESRNKLVDMARGEYLAVMDHDDVSLPERLEKQVNYLDAHPDVGVVGCWTDVFPDNKGLYFPSDDFKIKSLMMNICAVVHPSSMLRKSVLIENKIRYEKEYSPAEDYKLWCSLMEFTRFYNISEVLFRYRSHDHRTSVLQKKTMREVTEEIHAIMRNKYPAFFAYYTNTRKRVWCIRLCYNQEKYIKECLDSLVSQTFKDYEVIVIDDGSTDDSAEIVNEYVKHNKNIRLIRQANQGVVVARNNAIKQAQGTYIYPLDADDVISPSCLEKLCAAMEENKGDVIYSDVEYFGLKNGLFLKKEPNVWNMSVGNQIVVSALYRKSDWEKYGGYDENMKNGLEDWEFWLNFIEDKKFFYCICETLMSYRISSFSRSRQINKQQNKKLKRYVYKKHRFLFPYVIFNKICRFIFQKKLTKSGKLQLKFFKIPISIKLLSIEGTPKER